TPLPTATFTDTPSATPTDTETPLPTATFTDTPSATPTDTETPLPTATFTDTPSATPTDTETPLPTATFTDTPSATPTDTETPLPTATDTETPLLLFTPTPVVLNGGIAANAPVEALAGPDLSYEIVKALDPGTPLGVVSLYQGFDRLWAGARLMDGRVVWVDAALVAIAGDPALLPVVTNADAPALLDAQRVGACAGFNWSFTWLDANENVNRLEIASAPSVLAVYATWTPEPGETMFVSPEVFACAVGTACLDYARAVDETGLASGWVESSMACG
ncbi:MAG: hypothetical protein L6Q98_00005, partial [Anaerolineae bacterium]|nr:hypothetical protein [Anaerolineae bacterium]